MLRFLPKPFNLKSEKFALSKFFLTMPASLYVENVVLECEASAKQEAISVDHISGFLAGENPSKYQASYLM